MTSTVHIYTDGACRGNPGPGGWAALLVFGSSEKIVSGAEADTTNNRMELTAAIQALRSLKRPCVVELYTDSQYVRNGITLWLPNWRRRNWKTASNSPVKNADLWRTLDEVASGHQVSWHWVRGHSGHPQNERVDQAARQAIDTLFQ